MRERISFASGLMACIAAALLTACGGGGGGGGSGGIPLLPLVPAAPVSLSGTATYEFVLAWHFPNRTPSRCGWSAPKGHENTVIGNWYATRFTDAWEAAAYAAPPHGTSPPRPPLRETERRAPTGRTSLRRRHAPSRMPSPGG